MNAYESWAAEQERRRQARRDGWVAGFVLGGLLLCGLLLFAARANSAEPEVPKGQVVGVRAGCHEVEDVIFYLATAPAERMDVYLAFVNEGRCFIAEPPLQARVIAVRFLVETELGPAAVYEVVALGKSFYTFRRPQ